MQRAVQLPVVPLTQGRGVYECEALVYGRHPYYQVLSTGEVLPPYRARPYETDAEIMVMLEDDLDRIDPPPCRLWVMRDEVSAASWRRPSVRP